MTPFKGLLGSFRIFGSTHNRWDSFKTNSIELFIATISVRLVGAMLPRAHLAAGRPGQDANLLEQGDRGDDIRHFHHKNEEVHFEPHCSVVNLRMKMVS